MLFLSTPHRGSGAAALPLLMLQMAKVTTLPLISVWGNTRTDLVAGLAKDAEPLLDISKMFSKLTKNIKIASFYERSIIPPLKTVVSFSTGDKVSI